MRHTFHVTQRYDYGKGSLDFGDLESDPLEQLKLWLEDAVQAQVVEPTAMCLATVGPDGQPSARFVLLRDLSERGLTFFTNYESRKGQELEANPKACVAFWWAALERQVRVEGVVERLPETDSDAYFASRPRESQIASAASPQSREVGSREELEARLEDLMRKHPDVVPRPAHWGGYVLVPHTVEFWQGRKARFHDRILYRRHAAGWKFVRLAP